MAELLPPFARKNFCNPFHFSPHKITEQRGNSGTLVCSSSYKTFSWFLKADASHRLTRNVKIYVLLEKARKQIKELASVFPDVHVSAALVPT